MCDGPPSDQQDAVPEWTERNTQLATGWLTSFGAAIERGYKAKIPQFFHPFAVIFGNHRHGPVDDFDVSGFAFNMQTAKIAPLDRVYSLITAEWKAVSMVQGGEKKRGYSTFILYITEPNPEKNEKGSVVCVHAHFSKKE